MSRSQQTRLQRLGHKLAAQCQLFLIGARGSRPEWRRQLQYFYLRFIRLRGSPEAIARGLAAGVFAGWFPFFGLQILLGIALAALVRGNKLIAVAGTWVSNPFTYIPIYLFNFRVGQWLLQSRDWQFSQDSLLSLRGILSLGDEFILILILGCLVVGLGFAVVSYFVGLWLTHRLRDRHRVDRRRRRHKRQHHRHRSTTETYSKPAPPPQDFNP